MSDVFGKKIEEPLCVCGGGVSQNSETKNRSSQGTMSMSWLVLSQLDIS